MKSAERAVILCSEGYRSQPMPVAQAKRLVEAGFEHCRAEHSVELEKGQGVLL